MTYNLTAIYSGGPIDVFNGLNTQSNYVLLDALLIGVFIVILFIMQSRATATKTSVFVSATVTAVISAIISFAIGSSGYELSVVVGYSTRTLIWFAIAALALVWNVLSEA